MRAGSRNGEKAFAPAAQQHRHTGDHNAVELILLNVSDWHNGLVPFARAFPGGMINSSPFHEDHVSAKISRISNQSQANQPKNESDNSVARPREQSQ